MLADLAGVVLQHVAEKVPWSTPGRPPPCFLEAGRVLAERGAAPAGFHANQAHSIDPRMKLVKGADGIRAAADAGYDRIGQTPDFVLQNLRFALRCPITRWKLRTMVGYGCAPRALPRM